MGNNSVLKFIFHLSRFPVYRGSVLGRFDCTRIHFIHIMFLYFLKRERMNMNYSSIYSY